MAESRSSSSPSTKRRLLIVTHYYSTHGGGVENVAASLAGALLENEPQLQITWCAGNCDPLPPTPERLQLSPLPVWNGLEKSPGIPYPLPLPGAVFRLWREVSACDAAQLHDFSYASNALTALFCLIQRKPYFVTQHIGMVPYSNPVLRATLSLLNGTLGRAVLKRAARVVFYSRRVERYFGRFVRRSRREFIPNGVDASVFFPPSPQQRQQLRSELKVEGDIPTVAFVGRFVEKKGVPLVLELTKRFPQVRWLMAGRGHLDPGDDVLPNVTVWRNKSGKEIGDLMRAADVLVLPSQGEGFPLVVQEALACGTAVLAERELSLSQPNAQPWLELEPLGRPDDLERLTQRLGAMLDEITTHPEEAQQRRNERAAWANHEWNWTRCAREYLHLWEDIAKEYVR